MKQFEYTTYSIPVKHAIFSKKEKMNIDKITEEMNIMGKKGWELTTQFTNQKNGYSVETILIFKREIIK